MPAVLDEAEAHMLRASEARRVSWLSFRFSPDWELVAAELRLAAACFQAAGKSNRLVEALKLGTEAEVRMNRLVEAAKLQEQVRCYRMCTFILTHGVKYVGIVNGKCVIDPPVLCIQLAYLLLKDKTLSSKRSNSNGFLSTTAAAYEEALEALQQAVTYYRLSGNYDAAATLLCRIAEKREGEGGCRAVDAAARAYEEALALSVDAQRPICASEVCRNYLCMLVRRGRLEEAVSITLKRTQYLLEIDRTQGVHKALLTAVVLLLALKKPSEASSVLTCREVSTNNMTYDDIAGKGKMHRWITTKVFSYAFAISRHFVVALWERLRS